MKYKKLLLWLVLSSMLTGCGQTTMPATSVSSSTPMPPPKLGKLSITPAHIESAYPGYLVVEPYDVLRVKIEGLQNIASLQFVTPPTGWTFVIPPVDDWKQAVTLTMPFLDPENAAAIDTQVPDFPGQTAVFSVQATSIDGQMVTSDPVNVLIDPNVPKIIVSASPKKIHSGECVTVTWTVSNLMPGDIINMSTDTNLTKQTNLPAQGTLQDCPTIFRSPGGASIPAMYIFSVMRNRVLAVAHDAEVTIDP